MKEEIKNFRDKSKTFTKKSKNLKEDIRNFAGRNQKLFRKIPKKTVRNQKTFTKKLELYQDKILKQYSEECFEMSKILTTYMGKKIVINQ